ncbi:MAG: menaquinol oxidoreductase [Acidobacteria bacterium]|nr:MAG: menaquinol oxidoreductase [Acidobacteriota bacterium]REK06364.1 MAG: menaquinol oxidoreductase [Acidobacteriota bacterium]
MPTLSRSAQPKPRPPRLPEPLAALVLSCAVGAACASVACRPAVAVVEQPIGFDHAVHEAEGVRCVRCHLGAETQDSAGLMRVERCAACHRRVIPDHPDVAKVLQHWQDEEPILWRRVAWIDEGSGVQFSHQAHHLAGVECTTCHGDVASMATAQPPATHRLDDMDWCVDCHRDNEASIDCLTCHF